MAATETETTTGSLLVRRITHEDAAAVAHLCGQLGYEASSSSVAERIGRFVSCPESEAAFVACLDTEVVGWISAAIACHLQSPAHVEITGLVVKDRMRSLGVGRRLCAEVEAWSRSKSITLLRVRSRMTRERAHNFYLREGFTLTKTQAVFEKSLL